MFRKVQAMGFTREEIIDRTRQLGLTVQFVKQYGVKSSEISLRLCLKCAERFLSAGYQNRLCNRCRNRQ